MNIDKFILSNNYLIQLHKNRSQSKYSQHQFFVCFISLILKNKQLKNRNAIADVFAPTQSNAPHRTCGFPYREQHLFSLSKSIKNGFLFFQPHAHSKPFFIHLHPSQKTRAVFPNAKNHSQAILHNDSNIIVQKKSLIFLVEVFLEL